MRTILDRILGDATKPKSKEDGIQQLHDEKSAMLSKKEQQNLPGNLPTSAPAKPKPETYDPTVSAERIPISDITGSRGLVSQNSGTQRDETTTQGTNKPKTPYIPISVVTGGRDITTVSAELRAYLLKGSPSATNAIPEEYADVANVLEKAGDVINFDQWDDLSAKQQLILAQKAGLSQQDMQILLNSSPRYVETIAKIQDVFANRYEMGITLTDARNVAKELFDIANEREEAYTRTGKYANDAVIVPKALRWLDEEENKILDNLTKNASENDWDTEYTGGNPDLAARAARRATYAEIDQAAANEQIEDLIMKNVENAKNMAALSASAVSKLPSYMAQMLWFYNNVKQDAPMDYKNPIIWEQSLPGLPYPEEDKVYNVFGIDISSSDLGNLNYAMVGRALGISETDLLQQAGAAQLRKDYKMGIYESEIESSKRRDEGYGDQGDDQDTITNGFNIYNYLTGGAE